jgi:hypothetical protein
VERNAFEKSECEAIINGGVNIVKDVEGGVPVAFRGFIVVRQQEGVGWCEVGTRALSKPSNRTNHALVFPPLFQKRRTVVGLVGFRTGING